MLAIIDRSDLTPQGIIANGTGSLINTGPGQFLVTNDHVYRSFKSRLAVNPGTMLVMSGVDGVPFRDISQNHSVRGRDKDLDLAVLEIPVPLVFELELSSIWDSWPPPRPEYGMAAVVFGYPGQGRTPMGDSRLGVHPMIIGTHVTSSNERQFLLVDTKMILSKQLLKALPD